MTVRCDKCGADSPVVEVVDHGRVFYGLDCPRCGLYVPHTVLPAVANAGEKFATQIATQLR